MCVVKMNINTKEYIETFIKIRDKNGDIINFNFNSPQQKLYNIIKIFKVRSLILLTSFIRVYYTLWNTCLIVIIPIVWEAP